jgi:hypothetical protein
LTDVQDLPLVSYRKGNKWGFVSYGDKKTVILPKYDEAERFREGLALIKLNGKYGYVDKEGREYGEDLEELQMILGYSLL